MASPQLENGYTRIANELLDALIALRLTGQEWQIVWAIIRKTYGFNKKEDQISFGQLAQLTGIPRTRVIMRFQCLVSKRVLGSLNTETRKPRTIWFNKNFSEWVPSPKKETSPKIETSASPQIGTKPSPQIETHKRQRKDNITKDTLFSTFYAAYPKKKNKGDAIKAWNKISQPTTTLEKILSALEWQKKSESWTKDGGQYIPYPASYLNRMAWEDEPDGNKANGGVNDNLFLRTIREENERTARKRMGGCNEPLSGCRDSKSGTPCDGGVPKDADPVGRNPKNSGKSDV